MTQVFVLGLCAFWRRFQVSARSDMSFVVVVASIIGATRTLSSSSSSTVSSARAVIEVGVRFGSRFLVINELLFVGIFLSASHVCHERGIRYSVHCLCRSTECGNPRRWHAVIEDVLQFIFVEQGRLARQPCGKPIAMSKICFELFACLRRSFFDCSQIGELIVAIRLLGNTIDPCLEGNVEVLDSVIDRIH